MELQFVTNKMKLFGILHDADGSLAVRKPKALKVSIGLPRGKDVHVMINPLGKWVVTVAGKTTEFVGMEEAEAFYRAKAKTAPERKMPKKLPYFTFTRLAADGSQEPDFAAIAAHGPMPTDIPVALFGGIDNVFRAAQQMWTRSELQCHGDGINAERLVKLATPAQKHLIIEGARYFRIENGCRTKGCAYAKGDNPPCKPHMTLYCQLVKYPVVGGTAAYDSTSHKTIKAIGGALFEVFPDEGAVAYGLTMDMTLRPYRTKSGGAWYVGLRGTGQTVEGIAPAVVPSEIQHLPVADVAALAQGYSDEFAPEVADEVAE